MPQHKSPLSKSERDKIYREKHLEVIKLSRKIYYENNKDRIQKQHRDYANNHKEKQKVYKREYYINKKDKLRNQAYCEKYNFSFEEFRCLNDSQNGLCAICGEPESRDGYLLSVDHDHETGKIRGLLCSRCNTGFGGD